MLYTEYTAKRDRLKREQERLDKRYLREYPRKDLFGKLVKVTYRSKGIQTTEEGIFKGIRIQYGDIIPLIHRIGKAGKPMKAHLPDLYSMKQVLNIEEA